MSGKEEIIEDKGMCPEVFPDDKALGEVDEEGIPPEAGKCNTKKCRENYPGSFLERGFDEEERNIKE